MIKHLVFNIVQVIVVMFCSPLCVGVLARLEERIQSKTGPSIFQPYWDLLKLFSKDEQIPRGSSWIFRATPYMVFMAPIFVTLLIPVLTDYPLYWAFMGDMVGGGFVLALGGFFATLAAVDSTNPYGPMGASRTRMVGFLSEPIFIIVFFTVSYVANSTIPFIVQQKWVCPITNFFEPSHLLILVAFFMLILAEKGRLPVDNPAGHFELAMIEGSKGLEFSGKGAALMKWGGYMKFFVLMCIFLNVLVSPWGLASSLGWGDVLLAIPLILLKIFVFLMVLAMVESSLAKLRLYRISEFMTAAFVISVIAMMSSVFKH